MKKTEQIIIIGGGLAGLTASILLARSGYWVKVVEKKSYPFHRVCGEYISNEVKSFLQSINCYPTKILLPEITKFCLTSVSGRRADTVLDLGGFGVSRYYFDHFLFERAKKEGVEFCLNEQVQTIQRNGYFRIETNKHQVLETRLLISAHGKLSKVDHELQRGFLTKRSGYIGVKYHIHYDFPDDLIALHNFDGGYCGISKVENNMVNLCYLGRSEHLRHFGSIPEMEKEILYKNPYLKEIFHNAKFVFDSPMVINNVSFQHKAPVENDIIMLGDAAGLITPLCGNGMSIAIHSAKILHDAIVNHTNQGQISLEDVKKEYSKVWKKTFAARLRRGRIIQNLFGSTAMSNLATELMKNVKHLSQQIIRGTHGVPF